MGWTGHPIGPIEDGEGWMIYTRGGFNGVYVQRVKRPSGEPVSEEISIPRPVLMMLAAQEIRTKRISDLEGMSDTEMLGLQC